MFKVHKISVRSILCCEYCVRKGVNTMIIELDMNSSTPIYVQLRNQIVMGIGRGELKLGESLPTVRQLAQDIGVNTMTVNKAYQILKTEGYIKIDRRHGAIVSDNIDMDIVFREKLENELELLLAEAAINGMDKNDFLSMCNEIYSKIKVSGDSEPKTT